MALIESQMGRLTNSIEAAVIPTSMNSITGSRWHQGAAVAGFVLVSMLVGASLAASIYPVAAMFIAGFIAVFLIVKPAYAIAAMAGLTLAIAGSLKYFAGLGQFQWAISALGVLLLLVVIVRVSFGRDVMSGGMDFGVGFSILMWWMIIVVSSIGNGVPLLDWVVGIRNYLPFLGVFAYIAYCRPPERLLKGLIGFVLFIASVQWVFCLYQRAMIVPKRISGGYPGSPWDSVVGSFGGDMYGGGESGSLGVFIAITLSIVAALHKAKMVGGFVFASFIVFSLVAAGLSEAKVVVLLVPLGLLVVYRDYLVRQPVRFVVGGLFVVGAITALLAAYNYLYWQSEGRSGFVDAVIRRLSYSFDPDFRVMGNALGRVGSLIYWWKSHSFIDDPFSFLLGHGFASAVSVSSIIGMGTAAKENSYLLDTTGATKLLWESGFIGLIVFQVTFAVAFFRAKRLARLESIPAWHRAALAGAQAAMALIFLAGFYEVTTAGSPPMQFLGMLLVGYIVYWWKETGGKRQ